jgi:hypothetical protein
MASKTQTDETTVVFAAFGLTVAGLAFGVPLLIVYLAIRAYVLTRFWAWFVVPAFGLRPLTFAAAFGLLLVFGIIRSSGSDAKSENPIWHLFAQTFAGPAVFLAIGWALHQLILRGTLSL